jgi:cytochrome P450
MFARILAEMEADRRARAEFREEVRERFDRGASRMDELDAKIDLVHGETKKTNGRVTKIEQGDRIRLAKIAGAAAAASALASGLLWLLERGLLRLG